jgi:glutamine synthetase
MAPTRDGKPQPIKNPDGSLSEPARWLIGGLVQMGGALMAFGNRVADSFVRLKQGKEAPNAIVWGEYDRLALIRLPVVSMDGQGRTVGHPTIEFRLPDGSGLPHLLLAGAALAMLRGRDTEGLDDLLERTSTAHVGEPSAATPRVPRNFVEVADAVAACRDTLELGGTFPSDLIDLIETRLKH